jgi:type III pantothenate kinase
MAILDIDMGNTRTKWRCADATGALPAPELPTLTAKPERARVATVLQNQDEVAAAIMHRFGVQAEFAGTSASLGGVRCAYANPSRLGVDRWLALVAAWQYTRKATAVISLGTAATADFVLEDGHHEGGFIAPGLRTLRQALRRDTAVVRPSATPVARLLPGADTDSAVAGGTFVMLLAFVEAALAGFASRAGDIAVMLTGGDAGLLRPHLTHDAREAPHLVLDGLAVALP